MPLGDSASEKAVTELAKLLVEDGNVVVVSLARYDAGESKQETAFRTLFLYPEKVNPDSVVASSIDMRQHISGAPGHAGVLLRDLVNNGWDGIYLSWGKPHHLRNEADGPVQAYVYVDEAATERGWHTELDMLREILVAWSNARHEAKLVWKE